MNCSICEKGILRLFSHKDGGFPICGECLNKLPYYFSKRIEEYSSDEIKTLLNWEKEKKTGLRQIFFTTSSYGYWHLDSLHNLIAIGQSNDFDKGVPINNDVLIFEIANIENVSFDVNVEKSSAEEIKGSVFFSVSLIEPNILLKNVLIKKNETITPTMIDETTVQFTLPPEVQLMWNEVLEIRDKMIEHGFSLSGKDRELDKATGLYMVDNDFTIDQLKKQRNLLMKVFHPDSDTSNGSDQRSQKIIRYYELLKPYAKDNQ